MKKVILSFVFLFFGSISFLVNAANGSVTGEITLLRASHETAGTTYLQMDVSSAGACRTVNDQVLFIIPDNERGKQQFSVALAAKISGHPITVNFDDINYRSGEFCLIRLLDI